MKANDHQLRSQLAQIVSSGGIIRGTLLERRRTCGKPSCRCARGRKHRSVYLVLSDGKRQRQLYVPKAWESKVREWVANCRELKHLINQISEIYWDKVRHRRQRARWSGRSPCPR